MSHRSALALAALFFACSPASNDPGDPGPAPETGMGGSRSGSGGQISGSGGSAQSGNGGSAPAGSGGADGSGEGGSSGSDAERETSGPSPTGDGGQDPGKPDTMTPPPSQAGPVCPPGPYEAPKTGPSENICPGFNVKYNWNEGPTWVAQQKAFFFSNFQVGAAGPGDMIKYDPATNKCEVFIVGNGCNGLAPDKDGNIIGACHTPRALMKYDLATKKGTVLVDMVEGKKLDSPNDLALHSNGTIYFSNATYELGGRPGGLGSALLRLDPMGMVHVIAKGGINPLGISPDQKRLYAMGGYWDLDESGLPTKKAGGFNLGGDGIAVDCAGNVYTQAGNIVSPSNQVIGKFPGGTNQAFGGEDRKTLLIVRNKDMRIVKMNLPGLPQ